MIESKGGFLRLTRAGTGEDVWIKGSAITAIAKSVATKGGASVVILHQTHLSETITQSTTEILDAITASYREVTRR